jgi:type IX secretion system PorP/SprF family membrane protein
MLILFTVFSTVAQLTPMKSQYFQNQYLLNPSMAAKDSATRVYTNFSSQWTELTGAPVMMSLSASTPLNSKTALGFNLISDRAGLLKRTQAMGSFAYKLILDETKSIRFGVSLAWTQDRLDNSTATANGMNDPSLLRYNDLREDDWDGNFGISYITEKFEAQFSYLNLNQKRSKEFSTVDYSTFYSSLAYKFALKDGLTVKPLIAYRGVHNYKNQWDIAAEWGAFSPDFKLYSMYHSNNSVSGGFGYEYEKKLTLSAIYNSEPAAIRGITGGIFDIVLGYRFGGL